jgi:hypothetical protein
VPVPGPVDVEELTDALAELPARYVRIKGIVRNADDGGWAVVHRVGLRTSSEPLPPGLGEPGSPRLVALGHALSVEELAACVARAVVPSTGRTRP